MRRFPRTTSISQITATGGLRHATRSAFTLLESVLSVFLVGLLMVASLNSLGAAMRRDARTVRQVSGQQVACDLMNEILQQTYKEPVSPPVFGPESGETATADRSLFDDVDDYHGLSSVPKDRSGVAIPGFTDWTAAVTVQWADPATYAATVSINTGLKRITVTVSRGTTQVASIVAFRSIGWNDTIPTPSDATGNHPPVAVATSPGLSKRVGNTVSFDGSTSSDSDGDPLSYIWNFGDGTSSVGATVTKIYTAAGNYTCTLTVYDGKGGSAVSSLTAVISP